MTSEVPSRLTRIDELHLRQFRFLRAGDECYYLGEYTAREGFRFSAINDLVLNLKQKSRFRSTAAWKYKLRAIEECARKFFSCAPGLLSRATLVPIPPSRKKDDPDYDDRMVRVLGHLEKLSDGRADLREILIQEESYESSHAGQRMTSGDLRRLYRCRLGLIEPHPQTVVIMDDIITTGAHFRAASDLLREIWPDARILGLFVARTVWSDPQGEEAAR